MATTADVITGFGDEHVTYRQLGDQIGIIVSPRKRPQMISSGLRGYNLGLHDRIWYSHQARPSGSATYYVQIIPVWNDASDPDGNALEGIPTTENTTQGTTFTFDPFPDDYCCDGYRVFAGTVSGELYFQGTLSGRFNTTFVVDSTWSYATGTLISAQSSPIPHFVDALEIYQLEGAVDARCFIGGGKKYNNGYAKIATTTTAPSLRCGDGAQATAATWAAKSDASFKMRFSWLESMGGHNVDYEQTISFTGIDFSGDAAMTDVAATLQVAVRAARAPVLYGGTGYTTSIASFTAITDGAFDIWVDGVVKHVTACDFSSDAAFSDVASTIQTRFAVAYTGGTCTWDSVATRFVLKANQSSPTAASTLSYIEPNSSGTGTDISSMLDGRESSSTAVLEVRGKAATTAETVTWTAGTAYFTLTSSSTGDQYRFGYLETATANMGTDISLVSWMNGISTANTALYTIGQTEFRTVIGDDVVWGEWTDGMNFKFDSENSQYLVSHGYDDELQHLYLDADYSGTGFAGYADYTLLPFDKQLSYSYLGNPFRFDVTDVIQLPTATNDGITFIRRSGNNIAMGMTSHLWLIDGVDISAPLMVSSEYGAPNGDCVIEYGGSLFMYTGEKLAILNGGRAANIDTESRVREILGSVNKQLAHPHGVHDNSQGRDLLIWWFGIDSDTRYTTAIVYDPNSKNFWKYYHKDVNCSAMIRDDDNDIRLVTGSTYDVNNSTPAFTFVHDSVYLNDGASTSTDKTKQGIINSVASATSTASYLTCATAGSATYTDYQAITAGYFRISIDGEEYNIGAVNLSTASSMASAATLLTTAVQLQTGNADVISWSTDHFVITSGSTADASAVGYMQPYYPTPTGTTDLSSKTWMNGRSDTATKTYLVSTRVLTMYQDDGSTASVIETGADGEKGVFLTVCDTNGENLQYRRITDNDATTITISPDFTTAPVAGWYWFIGGIVPKWKKWFDFGAPQHKHKLHGIAITTDPEYHEDYNRMFIHGYQNLDEDTVRTKKAIVLDSTADTTNTIMMADQPATQHGIEVLRPSSQADLNIEDITFTQRPKV